MKITLSEVRRFQELAGLTESQVEKQLLATKPGDKIELTLDDDTKQQYVRVGTNSQNEPTFKMLKNDKPVSRESALAVSFIKVVKPIITRQMTGDPDVDFMGENKTYKISDIDFRDDGNRDDIFTDDVTQADLDAIDNGKAKEIWRDERGDDIRVYKLPTGEFMYAFPDADYFIKTPKGVTILK